MGAIDKLEKLAAGIRGKVEQKIGRVTDNPEREEKGRIAQVRSDLNSAGEKVKDAFER